MSDSPSPPKITTISSLTQPHCISTYCTNLFTSIPHLEDEGRSRGLHGQSQQSSRWTPTTAQLLILQELYRQGTKTPTAEQIHQIASQLRRFGKIEGKNVFYWFQNHKARERQKRRRREMEETAASDSAENHKEMLYGMGSSENQEHAGFRGTGYEVKETKKTASTSNCSGLAEEAASLDIAESGPNGWTKFEERGNTLETKAKCQNVDQLRTTTINSTSTVQNSTSQYHNLPFILKRENFSTYYGEENASTRKTLELFPLKRDDQDGMISFNERRSRFCASTSVATQITTSSKFFEFLPLKDRRNI